MIKMRKFFVVVPIMMFPIFCTFETGFLLYLTTTSAISFFITIITGRKIMRNFLKIPSSLPGTKLERMVNLFLQKNPMTNIGTAIHKSDLNKRI